MKPAILYRTQPSLRSGLPSIRKALSSALLLALCSTAYAEPVNLALNKKVTASTELRRAKLAVDGDAGSRWESAHKVAPSWLAIDLGSISHIDQVQIDWEDANAEIYEIQGSDDNSNWTTLSVQTGGKKGNRTDTIDLNADYRYLRIFATKHSANNGYGFSIWELKVIGTAGEGAPTSPDAPPAGSSNIAKGKTTYASSHLQSSAKAVDGNTDSRWESNHQESPSWMSVDLGSVSTVQQVAVHWEAANAASYEVQGSLDNSNWTTLATPYVDEFGNRTDRWDLSGDYRYIRINALTPSSGNAWGYSIRELEVFGQTGDIPPIEPTDPADPADPADPTIPTEPTDPTDPTEPGPEPVPLPEGALPLFPENTEVVEQIQYKEADGTLVTLMGARPTERHARERGEAWDAPDTGPGRYLTFPPFYFQNRTFGLEIRDTIPAGGNTIEVWLHVNEGSFRGTTFSLFRNIENPNVRDFGWSLNYGFNNPNEGGQPLCHSGKRECMMSFNSNWRTSPHSPLKVGDKIELAPAPRLLAPVLDGGGERYYSFEQLYIVGVGMRPWYGIAPNLDSEPLPNHTLLGGETSVSYNYSEEPFRMFQQMANNIGIGNSLRFAKGRRLFHTSFASGIHSESPTQNPVFSEHQNQLGPRYNNERCIGCHLNNGRSLALQAGAKLDTYSVFTGMLADDKVVADPLYGLTIQAKARAANADDYSVSVAGYQTEMKTLPDGTAVELQKPLYEFKGPVPELFSVRQAPQVIGLGLLEAIPEQAILANVDINDANGDGVKGVVHWVENPETGATQLGRFGWKATKVSARHQAAEALVQDIGVTSPVYPQRSCQKDAEDCQQPSGTTHISEGELQHLTQYLGLLGVPAQRSLRSGYPDGIRVSTEHDVNPQLIAQGKQLFVQSQCVACHTASFTTGNTHPLAELRNQKIQPYSDLLLHDMGPGLADNLPQGKASGSMWRTAPLWGLGSLKYVQGGEDKVRYLHDGRARTLDEAILWHGGEATQSRSLYENLTAEQRTAVKTFLQSL
ncbi:di-heme oxidoredictase family protein [Rheinheimera sp. 1928-s]|uniref:di-heme oxidoredictase family protein n=1 Tax=Rheinheimera sp. 1928-s TaxID=3033803 RepID=UPI0026392223|nr:di-heme oxidoredictase family protein [Rheinheimera sp. 1928-s]MDF3124225.1 di-heme oxidoredictase family protein [Rheinheimera sp. 1928-s]